MWAIRRIAVLLAATAVAVGLSTPASTAALPTMPGGTVYVGGQPTAGHVWIARTSGWPIGTTFTYAWLKDGVPITGATAPSYRVPSAWVYAHTVTLRVTGTSVGYAGAAQVSTRALRVQAYNPLAGERWGVDLTPRSSGNYWDTDLVMTYLNAAGTDRTLLGKIATRPRATWFGAWDSAANQARLVKNYIAAVQKGDPRTLVQLTIHAIWTVQPGGEDARIHPMTAAQRATYKAWITAIAAAIGTSRVAIIMEPDLAELPKAMTGTVNTADPLVRASLVAWATQLLAQNPNAAIYLDSGDSDWQTVATMLPWLQRSGIKYARGFALGATHYSSAADDITYGTAMVQALARAGLPGKHYVIDTADNGEGFTWKAWADLHGGATFNNATPCDTATGPAPCTTLGVAPTWQVATTRMPLSSAQKAAAMRDVDGYLWFSRPWLDWQTAPYNVAVAEQMALTSPYA